jgi:two-component system cell cycle sensor histidine kinase/response regulator CckA
MSERLQVLHVEDAPEDSELIHAALEAEGIECAIARVETREAFLVALERRDLDLIFSDFMLPAFDGFAALALARERRADLPFILISGTLGEEAAIESMKRGATDYVLKDRLSRLAPAVRRALEERRTARERSEAVAQLRQAQKMEALGQFAGGIAHDFNNILTVILATADLLRSHLGQVDPDVESQIHELSDAAARGRQLIARLMSFGRREVLAPRALDLGKATGEAVETFRYLLPADIAVRLVVEDGAPPARVDAGALTQILMNLATNARDAMPDGGRLDVTVREVHEARRAGSLEPMPGHYVGVAVRDSGTGMDEETKRRACEPLFTTKPSGKGTGLGLAMVLGLIQQHSGAVNIESAPGKGTLIELFFPAAPADAEAEAVPAHGGEASPPAAAGAPTLLIADDDPAVRRVLGRALERFGYRVLSAADGAEALATLEQRQWAVDLVISDAHMPKMSGPELYRSLRASGRKIRFLATSGGATRIQAGDAAPDPDPYLRVLPKPWTVEELVTAVRELLGVPILTGAS